MKQVTVTKTFSRTISQDYQSYHFSATLTETFEVVDDNDLQVKSTELFNKVRGMVEYDMQSTFGGQI
jgi:hypothetical protein